MSGDWSSDVCSSDLIVKRVPGTFELTIGALGGGISGSGPSIFMLSETKEIAEKVAENMQKIYNEIGIENYVYVSKINDQGIRIV